MLMAIAQSPRLSNKTHGSDLPPSWYTIYRLTALDDDDWKQLEARPGWSWDPREDGLKLGGWVAMRRGEYQKGKLDHDQIRDLEARPGWVWKVEQK